MANPKKRKTKCRRNTRRSHHALDNLNLTACPKCKKPKASHCACPNCGTYDSRQVVETGTKVKTIKTATKETKETKTKSKE